MTYSFHKDIVYTKVSGVPVLVALRGSWDQFPAVRQLSPLQGCFCQGILNHMEEDELIEAININAAGSKKKIRERYRLFIKKMLSDGSILPDAALDQIEALSSESDFNG